MTDQKTPLEHYEKKMSNGNTFSIRQFKAKMEAAKIVSDRLAMVKPSEDSSKDDHPKDRSFLTTCRTEEDGSMECSVSASGATGCGEEATAFFKCLFNSESKGAECQDKLANLESCAGKNVIPKSEP